MYIVRRVGTPPRERDCPPCGECPLITGPDIAESGAGGPAVGGARPTSEVDDLVQLEPKDRESIFEEDIKPTYLYDIVSQADPVVVYVMAQPGAGKSANPDLVSSPPGRERLRIVGDDFKAAHPNYLVLLARFPRLAGELIRPVYQEWQSWAVAYVRELHGDLVIEISPGSAARFLDDVADFRAAGYRVELVVLAVRQADSRQGIGARYAEAIAQNNCYARFTSAHGHDQCYDVVPDIVEAVERESAVDSVTVVRRDGTTLYRGERGMGDQALLGAAEALRSERLRPYSEKEAAAFREIQERLYRELPEHYDEWDEIAALARPLLPSAG